MVSVVEPATEEVMAELPKAGVDEADAAVARAKAAFPAWRRVTPGERGQLMRRVAAAVREHADELARLEARNVGKPISDARGEVGMVADVFDYYAGAPERLLGDTIPVAGGVDFTFREPLGVVGLITPWNFPIAIPAWKVAPALAYGNCVVLKPADLVPATAHALGEIIARSGIPRGVFNLVMGRGSDVGQAILEHPDVDAVSFTGSVPTGRRVAQACIASTPMKKLQLEMGGKNPLVVLDDADLKTAVECAVNGAFFSTGQRCTASSRLIVTDGIHDRFVEAMAERMRGLVVDDALKAGTHIGPVVDQNQLDQDLSYIRIGQEEGAKLAAGGERLTRDAPGFYLAPALFTEVDHRMRIAREEIFGPVATVTRVRGYDEALDLANDTEFGLSAGICTTSLKYANHFKRNVEAGMVMVNLPTAGVDYHVPFGGRKGSSYGPREQGRYAQEFYTVVKTAYTFDMNEPYVPKTKASE